MTVNLPEESPRQAAFRRFVNELVAIADRFGVNLIMPGELVKKDYETIALLKRYIESGAEEANQISVVLTKSEENKDLLPQLIASGRASFRITHPNVNPVPTLFGTVIDTGPVMEEFEADVKDLQATLEVFKNVAIGTGVKVSFLPLAPIRFSLMLEEANVSMLAASP